MNLHQLTDSSGENGTVPIPVSIPSLKRTLSGSSSNGNNNNSGGHSSTKPSNMNSISSIMHTSSSANVAASASNTGPPKMLRAVTSSGAFSRTGSSSSSAGPRATQTNGQATSFPTNVSRSSSSSSMQDWRVYLTIEERQAVRSKIRDAYKNRCTTFEELLHAASAIEEELLHLSAPSRLDYFKSGFEFENRVKLKREQLQGQLNALERHTPSTSDETTT